jgi:hypothetical protein
MAQYRNPGLEQAKRLNTQAQATFAEGTAARDRRQVHPGDSPVRVGAVLVAMGQRFKVRGVRIGANAVAFGLLAYGLYAVSTLPRL